MCFIFSRRFEYKTHIDPTKFMSDDQSRPFLTITLGMNIIGIWQNLHFSWHEKLK